MAEKEIEKDFVNTYIIKNRRERIIFELSNPKKRQDALSRFCHVALQNAIKQVIGNGMAAIMIWDNIVIIETEQVQGSAMKYVLCKKE